jgi:hypothetical protein
MASPVFVNSKQLIALASDSPLFKIASVLVRVDHVASFIVNANHGPALALLAIPTSSKRL